MVLSRAAQSKGGSAPPNAYISIGQSDPKKILILQGPVGPFFKELHNGFSDRGFRVRRVVFNPADCLFSNPNEYFRFSGSISDWEIWLSGELSQNTPDVIILFGSMRPAHQSARKLAEHLRIPVISLEEGYLRTGFVTCELGGNNQHSPLCQWHTNRKSDVPAPKALPLKSTFSAMSLWGAVYYLVRDVFSKPPDEALFHRKRESALSLSLSWMQHSVRRIIARVVEAPKLKRLRHNYLLVPFASA